jgi:hypothetical protein
MPFEKEIYILLKIQKLLLENFVELLGKNNIDLKKNSI